MLTRKYRVRVYRWVATLSLAAYSVFGVFGHSLHGLLPCDDGSCGSHKVAEHHCCCGDHEATPQVVATPAFDGAEFRSARHSADDCSLCTLLAKIKVGQAAMFRVDFCVEYSDHAQNAVSQRPSADLNLSGIPRAPPAC